MSVRVLHIVIALFAFSFVANNSCGQTIHVSLRGKADPILGKPVHWDSGLVAMVRGDGQLVTFHPSQAESFQKASPRFQPATPMQMKSLLMKEFRGFDVSGTGQFMVVHPAGQRDKWAARFEQLYRTMQHYYSTRGFRWQRPEFPFVAIVFPTERDYLRYSKARGSSIGSGTLGFYDPETNRIYMYDSTANLPETSPQWYMNTETIIHEAAHQTAFNVGIHQRFAEVPRWIVEGLGTMFEAKGIWDARNFPTKGDRVNQYQLDYYRRRVEDSKSLAILQQQITGDSLFRRSADLAYSHAWALTFYLSEQRPRDYARYIGLVNRRDQFREYTTAERIADFQAVFGKDLKMFDAHFQRFLKTL